MTKTFSVLYLSAHKDWRFGHTTNYNPQPHPKKLLLKEDEWPFLKEFKNQNIKKNLGFGSLCCLSPVLFNLQVVALF